MQINERGKVKCSMAVNSTHEPTNTRAQNLYTETEIEIQFYTNLTNDSTN